MKPWCPDETICAWIRTKYTCDPDTGRVYFTSGRSKGQQPKVNVNADDYERVALCNTELGLRTYVLVHRLVWFLHYGSFPAEQIDHINQVRTDHRVSNLRLATPGQNKGNIKKQRHWRGQACSSKFKGVYWNAARSEWRASIRHNEDQRYLGRFSSETEAAQAYNEAARQLFGEYAALNDV